MSEDKELILDRLAQIANLVPEQRFGQIIFNYICRNVANYDPFYIEDIKLLEILEMELKNLKKF